MAAREEGGRGKEGRGGAVAGNCGRLSKSKFVACKMRRASVCHGVCAPLYMCAYLSLYVCLSVCMCVSVCVPCLSVCSRPKHFLPLWPSIIKNIKVFYALTQTLTHTHPHSLLHIKRVTWHLVSMYAAGRQRVGGTCIICSIYIGYLLYTFIFLVSFLCVARGAVCLASHCHLVSSKQLPVLALSPPLPPFHVCLHHCPSIVVSLPAALCCCHFIIMLILL